MGRPTYECSVLAMQPLAALAEQRLGCCPGVPCSTPASLTAAHNACLLVDLHDCRWRVVHMNSGAIRMLGCAWEGAGMELHAPCKNSASWRPGHGMLLQELFKLQNDSAERQASRWRFTLRSVPGAPGTAAMDQCFDLHFSVATAHDLDTQQLLDVWGPARLANTSDSGLFAVHVHKSAEAPARLPLCFPDPLRSAFSGVKGGYQAAVAAAFMPRSTVATPIEGLVVGPLMGRGSSGHVHRGVYKGSPVAVKIIDNFANVRTNVEGQPLEAALTSGQHIGLLRAICCTFGANCHTRRSYPACWMLFDYCDKGCLADAIKKGWFGDSSGSGNGEPDRMNLRTAATTALEVATAMAHLHAHGVTHGDLSGGNILLRTSASNPHGFSAVVSDFGLCCNKASESRPSHGSKRSGSPSSMCGTITHAAPEVLLAGAATCTPAADVYAFGVLLWEMLSGQAAWAGLRAAQVVFQVVVLKQGLPTPSGLPAVLSSLLSCCLAQQAQDRCSFEEAAGLLKQYLDGSDASTLG